MNIQEYQASELLGVKIHDYLALIDSFAPKATDRCKLLLEIKIHIHHSQILKGKGCLEYALVFKAILDRLGIASYICRPDSLSHFFHAAIVYDSGGGVFKTFKVTGRDYDFKYIIQGRNDITRRITLTGPIITLVNRVKGKLGLLYYHQEKKI